MMVWPPAVPTKAVLDTLRHTVEHDHQGISHIDHFVAVLREEIGLQERKPAEPKELSPAER